MCPDQSAVYSDPYRQDHTIRGWDGPPLPTVVSLVSKPYFCFQRGLFEAHYIVSNTNSGIQCVLW